MTAIALAERGLLPAPLVRLGIRRLLSDRLRLGTEPDGSRQVARLHAFVKEMRESPLALHADTANAWLTNLERQREAALEILAEGANRSLARVAYHRWRIFFMACAELFGYRGGLEWFVSHCLCERADSVEHSGA